MIHMLSLKIENLFDRHDYIIFNVTIMLSLCVDLYMIIGVHLDDKEKVRLSITAKKLTELIYIFTYFDEICFDKIEKLPYFDNFTHIALGQKHIDILLPSKCQHVKVISFEYVQNLRTISGNEAKITHVTIIDNFERMIVPMSVTHLTIDTMSRHNVFYSAALANIKHLEFGDFFNSCIDLFENRSIQYLKLGDRFDVFTDFKKFDNLKQLILGNDFNRNIKGKIPRSITHLTFGNKFNREIFLPECQKMTHLTFGDDFNHPLNTMPSSVTHLTVGCNFEHLDTIPQSVTHIIIKN